MPNIIFTGDLNFPIIDWQMETADSGTHENQVQANAFLQFAQEQCLQQYIEEPKRKNNILNVFLTNNDQLTQQIITKTSMSDHNIIQIETNIKIVDEKQNHQIKKSNLSYRDLNFFNKDIYWCWPVQHKLWHAFNRCKNWWNVKDYYQYLSGNLQKNMFCQKKSKKTTNTRDFDEEKIKIAKENTEDNKSSNQRKCIQSD